MSQTDTFYITTAIDYPNGVPHMGHAYEKIVADFYARAARLRGQETRFLIGLDEHGLKIQQAAAAEQKEPQAFVDEKAVIFREMYETLGITHDDFIRTSEPRHHEYAQALYQRCLDKGDIYKDFYKTDYCVSCEKPLQKSDISTGICLGDASKPLKECPVTTIEEESYFFRLGKYRDAVRQHILDHPEFVVPEERRNEVLARLDGDLHDLSISRSSFTWGVPLPNDTEHVMYVWFDALANYASALQKPEDCTRFWPADCHVIGKDIIWFHAVIWPAMLLSAELPLPRQVYAHGFILDKDGRKMSKTVGNVVDPMDVANEFGVDVLRYYFLRAFSSGQDGNFALEELEERYKTELGNDLGNLIMRLSKLTLSRCGGTLSPQSNADDLGIAKVIEECCEWIDRREHHRALESLWSFLRGINAYLNETAPWKVKDDSEVARILYGAVEAVAAVLHLLSPAMPEVSRQAAETLGIQLAALDALQPGKASYTAQPATALFPRREDKKPKSDSADSEGKAKPKKSKKGGGAQVSVDPFAKLEIRVGYIEEVNEHPDADALYAMTVDIGGEPRSICAGLREHLEVGELLHRKVVVLANLKPAKLRGIESRGMILATDRKDGKVVPVDPGAAESGDLVTVEGIEATPKKKLSKSDFEKAPLSILGGRVSYAGKLLRTPSGELLCDAEDGAPVR